MSKTPINVKKTKLASISLPEKGQKEGANWLVHWPTLRLLCAPGDEAARIQIEENIDRYVRQKLADYNSKYGTDYKVTYFDLLPMSDPNEPVRVYAEAYLNPPAKEINEVAPGNSSTHKRKPGPTKPIEPGEKGNEFHLIPPSPDPPPPGGSLGIDS